MANAKEKFNWEFIEKALKTSKLYKDEDCCDGEWRQSWYVGSILNIYPSGKFYMPWSSNVTEEEAAADEEFREELEKELEARGWYMENPCDLDIHFCRTVTLPEVGRMTETEARERVMINGYDWDFNRGEIVRKCSCCDAYVSVEEFTGEAVIELDGKPVTHYDLCDDCKERITLGVPTESFDSDDYEPEDTVV